MKTYCNARLPAKSRAHALESAMRTALFDDWLRTHSDDEVIKHAQRKKPVRPSEDTLSVALGMAPDQSKRLSRLLDGKRVTFSALARNVFTLMERG